MLRAACRRFSIWVAGVGAKRNPGVAPTGVSRCSNPGHPLREPVINGAMMSRVLWIFLLSFAAVIPLVDGSAVADENLPTVSANTVESLTEAARKSVVVITNTGRDGKQQGLGSGFVIAADGLI